MTAVPADVELARACAAGDARAIAEVERRFGPDLDRALARLRLDAALAAEIRQSVREKLFVGKGGGPPGIASYEGKGPLGAFLRAVVVHAAMSAKRAQRKDHDGDSVLRDAAAVDDPELAEIRRRYGASFKQAFADALAELEPRDRNVLRLVYVEGLGVEQVALAYGVHRVSVSRWLADARAHLHSRTRALLRERLSLSATELASVARLCLSQIDVSLDRLLAEP
jgi:RNA polymerase sigma-70 factor (ECF subfamily)